MKYIINTRIDKNYFLCIREDGKSFKISKIGNTIEDVKKFIGTMNIKEII